MDLNGKITTVVGNGAGGFSGDGSATGNSIQGNSGVAFDPFGNLLVAPGEFQINMTVPNLPGAGSFPITINIDGKSSQAGVLFAYTN